MYPVSLPAVAAVFIKAWSLGVYRLLQRFHRLLASVLDPSFVFVLVVVV